MADVNCVVFDVGNVLIAWDPENLYRRLIPDPAARMRFLTEVCTMAWNLEQDRGRPWDEAIAERIALFPEHEALIRAFDEDWHEMVAGPIAGTVRILERLKAADVPLYAITNFSGAKFVEARRRFPFLDSFVDVVVSGDERLLKPEAAIYRLLLSRNGLDPERAVFIDDSAANIAGAEAVGMRGHLFRDPEQLETALTGLGLVF